MSKSMVKSLARKFGVVSKIRRAAKKKGYSLLPDEKSPHHVWNWLKEQNIETVLDIGACDGMMSQTIFMPLFPHVHIHSFEPSPVAFKLLQKTANGSNGRITAHHFGLGEENASLPFTSAKDSLPASSLLNVTDTLLENYPQVEASENYTVDIKILDEVAPALIPPVQGKLLVKIDVQGFEDRVIKGGLKTIAKADICLVEIQVEHFYEGQPSFSDIHTLLSDLGFAFIGVSDQQTNDAGKILYFDAVYVKPSQ